jgi:DNA-binding HxlR family transcriptional regulator
MMGDEEFMRDLYDLLHLFGDKWVSPIVVTLAEGPMRRVEILSMIRSYSVGQGWSGRSIVLHDSILARVLKKMTAAGLLIRDEKPGVFAEGLLFVDTSGCRVVDGAGPVGDVGSHPPGDLERAQEYSRRHSGRKAKPIGIPALVDTSVDADDDSRAESETAAIGYPDAS